MRKIIKNSCMDCKKRYVGCHAKCEDYKALREKLEKESQLKLERTSGSREIYEYKRDWIERRRKHRDSNNP